MKRLYYCLVLLAGVLFSFAAQAQRPVYSRVAIQLGAQGLLPLQRLGLAVDHVGHRGPDLVVAELSDAEVQLLQQAGISYTVEIPDLVRYYQQRLAEDLRQNPNLLKGQQPGTCPAVPNPSDTVSVPVNFQLGSYGGGYFTYAEMLAELDKMHTLFPNLITMKQPIGTFVTHENRPIYFVKISDNPNTNESATESQVLYDAVHHAREPLSMSQLIFYMYYLLENYGSNALVNRAVNNHELFFIPCLNPDGYIYNQITDPAGGGMWRKNRRNNAGIYGVDLNRNYSQFWGFDNVGSSPVPSSETYRGPSAASEPETQAMQFFCNTHQFKDNLSHHTFGNVFIYPWGHVPDYYTPDSARFVEFGKLLTQDNDFRYGTCNQTLGYQTNGDAGAWMYGEQTTKPKILSATPETGTADDGFWPQPSRIIPLCKGNVTMNLHLALLNDKFVQAELPKAGFATTQTSYVPFRLMSIGLQPAGSVTVSLQSSNPLVTATGTPHTYPLADLVAKQDSLSFTVAANVPENTSLDLVLVVMAGSQTWRFPFTRIYYTGQPAFAENFTTTTGWVLQDWDQAYNFYHSAPTSITDSPLGDYDPNSANTLAYSQPINLANATNAFLKFWARWDIEQDWDHVQVRVLTGAQSQPLCGRYTHEATGPGQPLGEPVYDGLQAGWVEEVMSLNDYLGQTIQLQVILTSDGAYELDGFYLDDLEVHISTLTGTAAQAQAQSLFLGPGHPNPAAGYARFSCGLPPGETQAWLVLTDVLGREVGRQAVGAEAASVQLSIGALPAGVYHCQLYSGSGQRSAAQRMVVAP